MLSSEQRSGRPWVEMRVRLLNLRWGLAGKRNVESESNNAIDPFFQSSLFILTLYTDRWGSYCWSNMSLNWFHVQKSFSEEQSLCRTDLVHFRLWGYFCPIFCSFFSVQKWIPLNEERTVTTPEQKHAGCVRLFCKHSTDRCWNPFISSTALACIKALSSPTITVKAFPFVLSFSPSCFVSCV